MGIVFRQSIFTSIISYVGVVIGYVNLLYLYPKFLTSDQIGLLRTIQDAAMLMVPFATLGLAQGVLKFFPQFSKTTNQTNSFVGLIVALGFAGYSLFLVLYFILEPYLLSFFQENAKAVIVYKNLILALTFLLLFMTIFEQFSKAILKIAFPTLLREIGIRIFQGGLILLYFYAFITFNQFIVGSVLIYVLSLFILIIFLLRFKIGFNFSNITIFTFADLKKILIYSSLSFVSVSAMIMIGKMDSIMVTGFLGLSPVAIYTTAYYMATVIEIPKRALTQATTTLLARSFEKNDTLEISSLYEKTANNQFIIGALLLIGIWANLENIFELMPKGEIYKTGAVVVVIVGIGKLIDMAFGPSSEIIGLSKYYWFNLVVITILAAIVITTNYFLIPLLGIEGAAYGSVIALIIYNSAKFIFIYNKLHIQPFTLNTIKVMIIVVVVVFINLALPRATNVFFDIIYRSGLITIVFAFLILATKSSEEVNRIYIQGLRYIGLKK